MFSREGVVSTSPNPQAGGPPLVDCPRLLIQFIHSYPPYRRPFLHPQPKDAPCRGDRDPHSWVHFTITLFNVGNVLLCVMFQLNFTVFMHVTPISRYIQRSVLSAVSHNRGRT
jgi:hypothetical protein